MRWTRNVAQGAADAKSYFECGSAIAAWRVKMREKSTWFYAVAVLTFGTYGAMLLAASQGSLGSMEGYASMFWTGLLFYLLWKQRARKGWHGALIGVVVGIMSFVLAAFLGGLMRH